MPAGAGLLAVEPPEPVSSSTRPPQANAHIPARPNTSNPNRDRFMVSSKHVQIAHPWRLSAIPTKDAPLALALGATPPTRLASFDDLFRRGHGWVENAQVRQVAVALGVIEPVANHEHV